MQPGVCDQLIRAWLLLQEFKSGQNPIMLATDVAARGLGKLPPSDCLPHAAACAMLTLVSLTKAKLLSSGPLTHQHLSHQSLPLLHSLAHACGMQCHSCMPPPC